MKSAPPSGQPERDGPASQSGSDAPAPSNSFGPTSFSDALGPVPKLGWSDERPAREHVAARSASLDFEQRADWLESEAKRQPDAPAKARLLLAASEVRAMLGAHADARRLALAAERCAAGTPWAAEQARALCQTPGEWALTARELREGTAPKSAAVRAHERLLAAEITRHKQRLETAAEADFEAASELDPSSTRLALMRLARQLAKSRKAPDSPAPDEPLAPLASALASVQRWRGDSSPELPPSEKLAEALADALRAAARGNQAAAVHSLSALCTNAGLREIVSWLSTFCNVAIPEADPDLSKLREFVRHRPHRVQRRLLAARAVALDRRDLLLEASSEPANGSDGAPVFSIAERRALSALLADVEVGGPSPGAGAAPQGDPLALALERVAGTGSTPPAAGSTASLELGLGLAAGTMKGFADLADVANSEGLEPWAPAVELERARESGDLLALAQGLPRLWARHAPEAHFVAGVLSEQCGDSAAARQHYQAAQPSSAVREAATRALATPGSESAALFRSLSAHAGDAAERSLLLTEALLRMSPDAPEFDALADEAVRADAALPFAYHLGEVAARMRGDRAKVARWLARQRESARDRAERLFCSIREALFWAGSDDTRAASLLESVHGDGQDLTLELLRERWARVSPLERARFRERAAHKSTREGRQGWLAEAIELYLSVGEREAARACARVLGGPIGRAWGAELAGSSGDVAAATEAWLELARETQDTQLRAELYLRSSRLASEAGERMQARELAREALACAPDSLAALRWLEVDAMDAGREADLFDVAARLGERLSSRDALPYLFVAARLAIDRGDFEAARPFAERACRTAPAPLWALRLSAAFARGSGDDARLMELCRELADRAQRPLDLATLALRAAQAAGRLGNAEVAKVEIERARAAAPDNVVVAAARAELYSRERAPDAASAYEDLAALCHSRTERAEALRSAAQLWIELSGQGERTAALLASAAELEAPAEPASPPPVSTPPVSTSAPSPPLTAAPMPADDRAKLEITRALSLIDTAQWAAAAGLLEGVLARFPHEVEAWLALADVHLHQQDWRAAERAARRAAEAAPKGPRRLQALRTLLRLPESELAGPEQLEAVCRGILELDADDLEVRQRLVQLLCDRGRFDEAIAFQRELVARVTSDEQRQRALLDLAAMANETVAGRTEAEQLLEQAQRTWPDSTEVLAAQVGHYRKRGESAAARVLLERAINGSRNALHAGRLEIGLLEKLSLAALLGGDHDTAQAARAAEAGLLGQRLGVEGLGAIAGQPRFDDLLAPAPLSAGFRRLLYGAGAAIERAFATDPTTLRTAPVTEAIAGEARAAAALLGLGPVHVARLDGLGCDCTCVYTGQLQVLFGRELLEHQDAKLREFLLLRALKIAQVNACAMSRLAPPELWAAVAGFLACFAPPWQAEGSDAQRLIAARNRIRPHVTATLSPEQVAVTAAVTSNVVPRAAQLGDALWRWASRVALLGVGELDVALAALWAASGMGMAPLSDPAARVRWIASHSSARDLVGYGVSEAYIEARRRAGLARAPS